MKFVLPVIVLVGYFCLPLPQYPKIKFPDAVLYAMSLYLFLLSLFEVIVVVFCFSFSFVFYAFS